MSSDVFTRASTSYLSFASKLDGVGMVALRTGLFIVLIWIGALKFADYEAEGIVPFVANSVVGRFVYRRPASEYKAHMNKEGELKPANKEWHKENGTYLFSKCLGSLIVFIGLLIVMKPFSPGLSALGSTLLVIMCLSTLSFLITTPEAWVQPLGDVNHGFPYLSGMGRLVVKDFIMFGAAIITLADAAGAALRVR